MTGFSGLMAVILCGNDDWGLRRQGKNFVFKLPTLHFQIDDCVLGGWKQLSHDDYDEKWWWKDKVLMVGHKLMIRKKTVSTKPTDGLLCYLRYMGKWVSRSLLYIDRERWCRCLETERELYHEDKESQILNSNSFLIVDKESDICGKHSSFEHSVEKAGFWWLVCIFTIGMVFWIKDTISWSWSSHSSTLISWSSNKHACTGMCPSGW